MVRFFPGAQRTPLLFSCMVILFCTAVFTTGPLRAEEAATAPPPTAAREAAPAEIVAVDAVEAGSGLEIRVKGSKPLISTVYELPNPPRIIVDVAEAKLAQAFASRLPDNKQVTLATSEVADAKPPITRLEFTLGQAAPYTSAQDGNDVVLALSNRDEPASPPKKEAAAAPNDQGGKEPAAKDQVGSLISQKKNIDSQLPVVNPLDTQAAAKGAARSSQDAFNFSGYNKERITVEFQKMDLHNVFNFLRQISGVNIVVDEAVKGSLTLVLDDVPWDFALDIILNLKDLEKEERFNTLVIYPKGKGFNWPEQAKNNLSFEADEQLAEKETLVIQQQESLPVGVMEAKQQMGVAREAEKREDFETAVRVYEQALEKWPDNAKLANKIASIYLVQLRQNAKALHFAKKALQAAPDNDSAALNAAIASANMQDRKSARHYFEQSVNAQKPSREALLSFAVFNEEQRDYTGAISVLEKHDQLYGKDLNGMVATARIYDKMGQPAKATQAYQAIQRSGYSIPPDLEKYIKGRIAMKQTL